MDKRGVKQKKELEEVALTFFYKTPRVDLTDTIDYVESCFNQISEVKEKEMKFPLENYLLLIVLVLFLVL